MNLHTYYISARLILGAMDDGSTICVISQFFYEHGYHMTLDALKIESGREFKADEMNES